MSFTLTMHKKPNSKSNKTLSKTDQALEKPTFNFETITNI